MPIRTVRRARRSTCLAALLVSATTLAGASLTGCAQPRQIYDPAYRDNHRWDGREDAAYRRWEIEQHIAHAEYAQRNADEQRAYWGWRHEHP